ncbi:MAG: TraB/GumN family protein [Ferruginibacter sp.]
MHGNIAPIGILIKENSYLHTMKPFQLLRSALPLLLFFSFAAAAQTKNKPVYNSLLWEITGNGLKKPSYLFGTMHVSSKLAFHLGDSFYYAMKRVDAVALELNPEIWQPQMVRLNDLNQNYSSYIRSGGNDYLNEKSFRIQKFDDKLKLALNSEPPVVNNLLYRSYREKEDFEEDTFLDLYIFQTGRKLGKSPAGVEDFYESEKTVMEAYADMAKEKKKKEIDLDGETMSDLIEKMQDAYRRGDLDLMDSLDNKMERSVAFREKFLYKRNEVQARSIDSIIKSRSLFVGVGAAHLPGERGVIEILRKKGYKLRPVKMTNRDALQKDVIENMKVKVNFTTQYAPDGMYAVDAPGPLYFLKTVYAPLSRWQFADMNNGSYYMVTRVKTYASFLKKSEYEVMKKIDSFLYENIPGKILSKKLIENNGYTGYDISNRTRRGDLQRYQVFVTPYEVLIFKMSGKNNYVNGEEAARFFSSIQLKKNTSAPLEFSPAQGGFAIALPHEPNQYFDNLEQDRWEYEARDKSTGDAFMLMKKDNYNFDFIEEDTFDLKLLEESFRGADFFDKQISRRYTSLQGAPALQVREKLKDGDVINAVYVLKGPQYYVLARRTANASDSSFAFANSFRWKPYVYNKPAQFADTFLHIKMQTPVQPDLDEGIRSIIEKSARESAEGNNSTGYITYWPRPKNALLKNDSTGEMVSISVQEYPKYYYIKNPDKFWEKEIEGYVGKEDMLLQNKTAISLPGNIKGYRFTITDTGSARTIERMILLKGKYMYTLATMSDTLTRTDGFAKMIFSSFTPLGSRDTFDVYSSKLKLFFDDLFSADSALHKKAQQSLTAVNFGPQGAPLLMKAIDRININDKDYFDTKAKMIAELGYIEDSVTDEIPLYLKKIYAQTADTSLFQNEAVLALSRLKTSASFRILKEIMLQDPPIFDDEDDYSTLFDSLSDTLELSRMLYPDFLQLATLQDYKEPVTNLLLNLVDSGLIKKKEYARYFPGIYIDAKVALRKQQNKDEKKMQQEKKKEQEEEDSEASYSYGNAFSGIEDYAVLMMPFYDENQHVQQFFQKLIQSRDDNVRMNAALLMLRNNKPVPDSVFANLAAKDKYRGSLYYRLEKIGRLDKFPAPFKTQEKISRSFLVAISNTEKPDSIAFISKQQATLKNETGLIYFYKYKLKKTDEWKIGLSGLQPLDGEKINSDDRLTNLTDKKLKDNEPVEEQLNLQLKKLLFGFRKSASSFFDKDDYYNILRRYNPDYGD